MSNLEVLRKRLGEAIKQSKIPQKQLGEMLGISQSCIAHYIKGDILPSLERFVDLCTALDVDPSYILGFED